MPPFLRSDKRRQLCDTESQDGRSALPMEKAWNDIAAKDKENRERQRAENERQALEAIPALFKSAVAAWPGGQDAYAARLGVSRSIVVEYCNGKNSDGHPRLPTFRDVLPLREHAPNWRIWCEGEAAAGGLLAIVRTQPSFTFADLKDEGLEFLKRNPSLWELFKEWVSRRRGVDEEDVDTVYERGPEGDGEPVQHSGVTP